MTFFNKQEDVIDIELTSYGKKVLSLGKFNPVFYEFFDQDIIYDSLYAGISETQGDIQTRIKQTPRNKVQYSFESADLQNKRHTNDQLSKTSLSTASKHYALNAPIGSSEIGNIYTPAWNIKALKGEFQNTIRYQSGSHPTQIIPQITVTPIVFESYVNKKSLKLNTSEVNITTKVFEDGTFIEIDDDFLLLDVSEENSIFNSDNFDIEVYLVDKDFRTDRGNKEVLTPLFFKKPIEDVVNNILVDILDEPSNQILGPTFVEHFFNVYVDKEISSDTLCTVLTEEEIKTLAARGDFEFECIKKQKIIEATPIEPNKEC